MSRDKIDPKVIDGHIVPNVALFSRPAIRGRPVQTLAFSDNLKVSVSFSNESLPSLETGSRGECTASFYSSHIVSRSVTFLIWVFFSSVFLQFTCNRIRSSATSTTREAWWSPRW